MDFPPSAYSNDDLTPPLTIRLPEGMLTDLDAAVSLAQDSGHRFVNRTFMIREAIESYVSGFSEAIESYVSGFSEGIEEAVDEAVEQILDEGAS